MKASRRVALAGVFSALCVVLLFIGSVFDVLDLTTAAFAGFVILVALTELGSGSALAVYAVSSVIAALILPNKGSALFFAVFSGYYPVLKVPLNKIKPKWLSRLARILVFNAALAASAAALVYLLQIPLAEYGVRTEKAWYIALFVLAANAVFIVYDLALERASVFYVKKIRNHVFGKRR
ncbi:MAG: hypothetical protein J5925_05180 [Clostridia bacterium]|nr:hypothetical protein [Clostridia bacterium]